MKIVQMARFLTPRGTFSRLTIVGVAARWATVELLWRDNTPNISCVPVGVYLLKQAIHKGKYPCYQLVGVPGRSAINFHIANRPKDLLGCIGVGTEFGVLGPDWAVLNSTDGFNRFMEKMDGVEAAYLFIYNEPAGGAL